MGPGSVAVSTRRPPTIHVPRGTLPAPGVSGVRCRSRSLKPRHRPSEPRTRPPHRLTITVHTVPHHPRTRPRVLPVSGNSKGGGQPEEWQDIKAAPARRSGRCLETQSRRRQIVLRTTTTQRVPSTPGQGGTLISATPDRRQPAKADPDGRPRLRWPGRTGRRRQEVKRRQLPCTSTTSATSGTVSRWDRSATMASELRSLVASGTPESSPSPPATIRRPSPSATQLTAPPPEDPNAWDARARRRAGVRSTHAPRRAGRAPGLRARGLWQRRGGGVRPHLRRVGGRATTSGDRHAIHSAGLADDGRPNPYLRPSAPEVESAPTGARRRRAVIARTTAACRRCRRGVGSAPGTAHAVPEPDS